MIKKKHEILPKDRNQKVTTKCAKKIRFEPRFHGFVVHIDLYQSVKSRLQTLHFSAFHGPIMISPLTVKKKHEGMPACFFYVGVQVFPTESKRYNESSGDETGS